MTVFYVLLAILLFGVLIFVHELGHFLTAKAAGVRVNEFSLFMGPAIWKKQRGETLYALRTIPIGGYCAMEGEDGDSDDPRAFSNAKVWQRLIILVAGACMNFLCGLLIIGILFSVTAGGFYTRQITDIAPQRPFAEQLQVGDELLKINCERVYTGSDITLLLDRDTDGRVDLTVRRDGETVRLENVPMARTYFDENGNELYGFSIGTEEKSLGAVCKNTWRTALDFARLVRLSLVDLFTGKAGLKDMSGPVGIVSEVAKQGAQAETVGLGLSNVFYLFAFIAVNLAVMNLLPIPALDGGRVVCLLVTAAIEKIFRKRLDPKYEGYLNGGFMILLMALMVLIVFKDVFQLFGG